MRTAVGFFALLVCVPSGAGAQEAPEVRSLTLEEAVAEALDGNPDLRIAGAEEEGARAAARGAAAPLWPHLAVEAGGTRSVDPVFAFGSKLRQGRFTREDLALDALNDPDALSDWHATAGVRWGILDPTRWQAREAAEERAEAAGWAGVRTREATIFRTKVHYYRAIRAEALLSSSRRAEEAAGATLERFRRRRDEGLLTDADVLQAEAELRAAEAAALDAGRLRAEAREALGLHLGWGPGTMPAPADSLPEPGPLPEMPTDVAARADLQARDAAVRAAGAEAKRALLSFVPSVDLFGRYGSHAGDPLDSDDDDWTVGLALRLPIFTGFARTAALEGSRLRERIARTELERATRTARVEVGQAGRAVRVARSRLEASRAASAAAREGVRLMRLRFEEGLATATDLLQAEARAAGLRARAIEALTAYHVAVARLEFVTAAGTAPMGQEMER